MAGDRRATMGNLIAHRDIEKVFADRRVHLRRHRRHRRAGDRAGAAVPGRARALREDRGRPDVARGQGQPAATMIRGNLGHGDAGPGRRAAVRRVRHDHRHRPDLLLRRDRRLLRGARPPQRRVRLAVRPRLAEEALPPRRHPRRGRAHRRRGALRRRRRRLRHRRPRRRSPDLADDRHRRRRRRTLRARRRDRAGGRRDHRRRASTTREVPDDRRDAVLRLARAADEGPGRLRAQGHRARSGRHRPRVRQRHRLRRREPQPGAAQGLRDLRPDRLRRGRQVQRVREPARGRGALRRPARLLLRPLRRHRRGAWRTPTPRPSARCSPRSPSPTRSRSSSRRSGRPRTPTRSTGSPTTARSPTSTGSSPWAAEPSRSRPA